MADPLSISASIVAIIQLCQAVVNYLRDVQDAGGERNNILLEISASKGVLETLNELCLVAGPSDPLLANLRLLRDPLHNYETILQKLEKGLAPLRGLKKVGKTLKWPFEKQDALSTVTALGRFKGIFALALQIDNIAFSKAMKEQLDAIKDHQENEEVQNIVRWFSSVNFAAQHQDIFSKHQEGTAQWLLQDEKFIKWSAGQPRLLWCPGVPGAGKTFFAAIALDHLTTSFKNEAVAVLGIYCDYKEFNHQSTSKYLSSLIQQIIIQRGLIPDDIKAIYAKHMRHKTLPSFPELLQILQDQMKEFHRVFIIIDALDECTEQNGVRDELLEGILQLPDCTSVMVTSRYIPGIEEYFGNASKLPVHAHDDDIRLHVVSRLAKEKTWSRRVRIDGSFQNMIANSVIKKANGMFLLAQLHISSIIKKHSRKDVERALNTLPEGLASTYDQILQRIDDQGEDDAELAREILSWLTYALRPLKASELQQALAIKPQDRDFDEDGLIHQETIVSVCVGLVVTDQESGVIHLVHYTTLEYFVRTGSAAFPKSPLNLVTTCLTFLLFDEATKESMPDLYSYVADNWGHHARESPETPELVEKVVTFLRDEFRLRQCVHHMSTQQLLPHNATRIQSLHLAAKFDLVLTMERLLEQDLVDINLEDHEWRTPLYHAAMAEQGSVLKLLLGRPGIEIDRQSRFDGPPLHRAIASRRSELAILLLKNGADPQSVDTKGERPIHKAIKLDLPVVLQDLLSRNVDITATTNTGHTPLELAMPHDSKLRQKTAAGLWRQREISVPTRDYTLCLKLLLESLSEVDINRGESLFDAVKDGRPDIVRLLLEKGGSASFKSTTFNLRTPLHWAAEKGFTQISELLLKHGSQVASQDRRGFTPLHYAAMAGHESIIDLLLPKMENLDIAANDGMTAYQHAKVQHHEHIVQLLLDAGASDHHPGASSNGPDDGVQVRHMQNAGTYLSGKGANTKTVETYTGQHSPSENAQRYAERFILAAAQGDIEGVLLCLSKGVKVGERDHVHHKTALHWAAECGYKDISQLLLDRGSSLTSQDQYGETPLHYAADSGHVEIARILLKLMIDVTVKDDRDRTALMCARNNYHIDTVKAFLNACDIAQLEPDVLDKQNKTLCHWAAEIGDTELCRRIMTSFPDAAHMMVPDNRGWTPAQYAKKNNDIDLATRLENVL